MAAISTAKEGRTSSIIVATTQVHTCVAPIVDSTIVPPLNPISAGQLTRPLCFIEIKGISQEGVPLGVRDTALRWLGAFGCVWWEERGGEGDLCEDRVCEWEE